jgi:DNA-binding transcriptional ArsR family regulator
MAAQMSEVFRALGHTDRLAILDQLRQLPGQAAGVSEVADLTGISRFAASYHLGVLREAGILWMDQQKLRRVHRMNLPLITEIEDWAYQLTEAPGALSA